MQLSYRPKSVSDNFTYKLFVYHYTNLTFVCACLCVCVYVCVTIHQRGQTVLIEALRYNYERLEIVTVLVRAGAKMDIQDEVQVVLFIK